MRQDAHLIFGIALGAALFASPLAWADGGGQCHRYGGERHAMSHHGGTQQGTVGAHMLRHLLMVKQELGLTDEQITTLRTTALDADRAGIRAEAEVRVSQRELRALLWDQQAEMPAIEAKVKEQKALEATARIISIRAKRDLLGVLTAEQRAKQKALRGQHRHSQSRHMMRADAGESISGVNGIEPTMETSGIEPIESRDGLSAG